MKNTYTKEEDLYSFVYLVRNDDTGERFVAKWLGDQKKSSEKQKKNLSAFNEAEQKVKEKLGEWSEKEALHLRLLRGHPHVIQYLDHSRSDEPMRLKELTDFLLNSKWHPLKHKHVLCMEYAEKGSLRSLIKKRKERFVTEEIMTIVCSIAVALSALHHQKMSFGDLKPENVFHMADGRFVLGDFESSMIDFEEPLVECDTWKRTSTYEPHEIEVPTASADMLALSIILCELLIAPKKYLKSDYDKIIRETPASETSEIDARTRETLGILQLIRATATGMTIDKFMQEELVQQHCRQLHSKYLEKYDNWKFIKCLLSDKENLVKERDDFYSKTCKEKEEVENYLCRLRSEFGSSTQPLAHYNHIIRNTFQKKVGIVSTTLHTFIKRDSTPELMKEMEKEAPRQRTIKTLVKGGADLYSQPTDNKWPPLLEAIKCSSVIEAILDTASSIDFTRVYPMQERSRIGEVVQKPITFLGAVVKERKDLLWMVRLLLRRHEKHPEEKLNWLDPVMEGKRKVPFIDVVLERHMKEITTDIWKQLKESTSQPFPPRLRITLPCALRDTWNTSVKEVEPEWR